MRYAVISDIHANLEALTAVLSRIDREAVDQIVCLGDIVGYFANPTECLKIIRDRRVRCIAGNHDRAAAGLKAPTDFWKTARRAIEWTSRRLTADDLQFLKSLKLIETIDDRFVIVHGGLHPEPNDDVYLLSEESVKKSGVELIKHPSKVRLCFFGQTHRRAAYEYSGVLVEVNEDAFTLHADAFYLVNPGSVGQSRDGDPRASFLIFDADTDTIRLHRVAYDLAACHLKARQAGLLADESAGIGYCTRVVRSLRGAMELILRT